MTSAGGHGHSNPVIAGALNPNADFHEFSEDELNSSNPFNFADSPDTLQTLESTASVNSKDAAFLNPQELAAGPFPDSPNSYHDSSSESAESSSKRADGSVSHKTPPSATDMSTMDPSDVKMEWNSNEYSFDDDDNTFNFGASANTSNMSGLYGFGEQDDSFMDQSFDFESASSSPDAVSAGMASAGSPGIPVTKPSTANKTAKPATKQKKPAKKKQSVSRVENEISENLPLTGPQSSGKQPESREVSPMSTLVASHNSSPGATFLNSPQSNVGLDFAVMNGAAMWPNKVDMSAPTIPDSLPTPAAFPNGITPAMAQQMQMFGAPFNFTGGYELRILPTPLKSRVETQIPIKMTLSPMPPGVTKLHLPAHTISKPKLLAKPQPARSPDTLELHVNLVCTSAMENPDVKKAALQRAAATSQGNTPTDDEEESAQNGGEVRICTGCITRERKRAARKKIKKPDEEKMWSQDEERRVIVFNTQEVKNWQPLSGVLDSNGRPEPAVSNRIMQIDAPMRIACYCRHHGEKSGFNVIFTIKDYQDRVVAQAMSNPIMITDDHKTHPMAQANQQPSMSETVTSSTIPTTFPPVMDANSILAAMQNGLMGTNGSDTASLHRSSQASYASSATSGKTTPTMTNSNIHGRSISRPTSPSQGGPSAKRRKGSATRVPNGLEMTRLDTSPAPGSQGPGSHVSNAASPFSPNSASFQADGFFGAASGQVPFANGPPTPNSNEQSAFFNVNRSTSMDNLAMAQLYSAPASSHPSRAPSPNGLRNSVAQAQMSQAMGTNMFNMPMNVAAPRMPMIHKVIPNQGPKIGGIEVTVLGSGFFQGLDVWFGDQRATTTTYWGEQSLVCLLPPSAVAGVVPVTFKHSGVHAGPNSQQSFKYIDDNEDKLIRTALSVLGHKMSGQMVDVSDLARRILNDGNSGWTGSNGGAGGQGSGSGFTQASHEHLESQLLKCLDLIDLDDSEHRMRLDLRRPEGHTMLHLACSLGYHRFVAALLARGANTDARDKGGFTPLHMAALHSNAEIVRRLIIAGADPTMRSLSGLTAADVTQSRAVLRAIRSSQRHVRSRSGGSIHSRASSATSLRSLWEPLTRANTHSGPLSVGSSEESPEYTSGDFSDEDPDENNYLSMRRPSSMSQNRPELLDEESDAGADATNSPTAVAAALKDQFQQQLAQIQQSVTLQLQNLAQLPQMRVGIPYLPDYQAYLQQAPFVQRMTQLMPRRAPRPGSSDSSNNGSDTPKIDGRWWDISSYMGSSTAAAAPPPAYDEIFPQKNLDEKHRSAAQAAAEAEADLKCAAAFDTETTTTATRAKSETKTKSKVKNAEPSILMIGRKNQITREQQEQFLRAHEQKLKGISSDRNLFFVWIPLLLVMICAMLYNYFPALFPFVWTSVRAVIQVGSQHVTRYVDVRRAGQVVEV